MPVSHAPKSDNPTLNSGKGERQHCVRLISYIAWPAACCGTARMVMLHLVCGVCAELRTGCLTQCFAHAAGCVPSAARRTQRTAVLRAACCISHVLASPCMLSAFCCTLSVACCPLGVAGCLLSAARCLPSAACRMLRVVCCLVWRCPLHAVCCLSHVVCCMPPVVGCTGARD